MTYCYNDIEISNGQILLSNSIMLDQISCKPNTGNAGNYYSFPGATVGSNISSGNAPNSICSKGWKMTINTEDKDTSWYYLIRILYNTKDKNDSKILHQPISLIRSGEYNQGSLLNRASGGTYWPSTASRDTGGYYLMFNSTSLNPQNSGITNKHNGYSLRCIAELLIEQNNPPSRIIYWLKSEKNSDGKPVLVIPEGLPSDYFSRFSPR